MLAPVRHIARFSLPVALLPLSVFAADFWESKPFPEWSDKELQRMMTNSPWAKQINAPMPNPNQTQKRNEPLTSGLPDPSNSEPPAGGGRGSRTVEGGEIFATAGGAPTPTLPVFVRWISALPIKQAQMRGKYGKEAGSAPEAQKFLETKPTLYIIAVTGIPGLFVSANGGDRAREDMAKSTTLTAKGKPSLKPIAIQLVPNGGNVDVILGFERKPEIALEDQEAEFESMIGNVSVKYRFKLKDMAVKGKLEL
jgi:hypothetical protein